MKMTSPLCAIPLLIALFTFGCKDKKDQTPEFGKPAAPAATSDIKPDTAGGKRWVWSPDGVILREEPKRTAKQLALIPRGEEIEVFSAAAAPPVADTVSGDAGHWVKANIKGKSGWVFDFFLSSPPPADALEYGVPYKMKTGPYAEHHFFTFKRDGSASYGRNVCEGFDEQSSKFTIRKGQIFIKDATIKLEIHGHTSLLMVSGGEEIGCGDNMQGAEFEIPAKR